MTVQVSETSSVPSPDGMIALCSAARTGSRSSLFPDGALSQVRRRIVRQPAPVWPSGQAEADAFLHAGDDVPARGQDRRDQVIAGEMMVEAGHAAGEQAPGGASTSRFSRVCSPARLPPRMAPSMARPARWSARG